MTAAASWSRHLRGHLLQFDPVARRELRAQTGVRLLLAAMLLELVRLAAVAGLRPGVPLGVLLPALLVLAVAALPAMAGTGWTDLGLRPWSAWTTTERSYFVQVLILANVIFPVVLSPRLAEAASTGIGSTLWHVILPYLCFGFYQELVYRGALQTAFVKWWGAPAGILAANAAYTFGPLHWVYFAAPLSLGLPMFLAIFIIGAYFGVLYQRSGNLWLPAVFHAIGNAYMVWSVGPATLAS